MTGEERAAVVARHRGRYHQDPSVRRRQLDATAAWYQSPNGKAHRRLKDAARRARVAAATVERFTHDQLLEYWAERNIFACAYCNAPWEHIDHVMPLSKGGVHAMRNLLPACAPCNLRKSDMLPHEWWEIVFSTDSLDD